MLIQMKFVYCNRSCKSSKKLVFCFIHLLLKRNYHAYKQYNLLIHCITIVRVISQLNIRIASDEMDGTPAYWIVLGSSNYTACARLNWAWIFLPWYWSITNNRIIIVIIINNSAVQFFSGLGGAHDRNNVVMLPVVAFIMKCASKRQYFNLYIHPLVRLMCSFLQFPFFNFGWFILSLFFNIEFSRC